MFLHRKVDFIIIFYCYHFYRTSQRDHTNNREITEGNKIALKESQQL